MVHSVERSGSSPHGDGTKHKWSVSLMKCGHRWRRCTLCWEWELCEHGKGQPLTKDREDVTMPRGRPRKQDKAPEADPIIEEPVLHGMVGNGAISEPCPNCLYAYADGGYCPHCGWTLPIRIDEYGTHSGRRF